VWQNIPEFHKEKTIQNITCPKDIWFKFTELSFVLGSARTGLIFTGIQEGTQPAGLTPPGQTEQGIPYHVPSCWVPVGGSWVAGTHSRLGSSRWRSWRAALWVVQFVLCFLLICIVVVPVPFVCCSVKLPLSWPTSFCLFLSILLHTPAGGGAASWHFCCRPQPNQNIISLANRGECSSHFVSTNNVMGGFFLSHKVKCQTNI